MGFLHASVTGLVQVFAWPTFGLMLLGMALGFVVGPLPGLGGPTTLALMLPFVFKMTPVEAFAFLLGMLAVTATTGDITSILFGIPGEPTTAATIVETRRTAAICGWILGMYAAIWLLGFSLATLVTTFLYLRTARERWSLTIALSLAGFAFVYGLFEKALSVPFPPGQLLVWLGHGD